MNLDKLRIKAEKALELAKKASEAPWTKHEPKGNSDYTDIKDPCGDLVAFTSGLGDAEFLNAEFIAASRILVPDLAEGVLELLTALKEKEAQIDLMEKMIAVYQYNEVLARYPEKKD